MSVEIFVFSDKFCVNESVLFTLKKRCLKLILSESIASILLPINLIKITN